MFSNIIQIFTITLTLVSNIENLRVCIRRDPTVENGGFSSVDKDGDSYLTKEELVAFHYDNVEEAVMDFLLYDEDGDEKLSLEEWKNMITHEGNERAFDRVVDSDHDGNADYGELFQLYSSLRESMIEYLAKKAVAEGEKTSSGRPATYEEMKEKFQEMEDTAGKEALVDLKWADHDDDGKVSRKDWVEDTCFG